jgi:hypothetical protein
MNTNINLPLFDEVNNELARLDFFVHGSECHGAICGYLCANRGEDFNYWFTNVLCEMSNEALEENELPKIVESEDAGLIYQLFQNSMEHLKDLECGMRLLLPDDDESLSERVDALAEWCHGFLYGLTVMAANEISQYSAEAQEVISDFVKISQSDMDTDENGNEDETALMEIVEYVRIGAMLIWSDSRQYQREEDASPTVH